MSRDARGKQVSRVRFPSATQRQRLPGEREVERPLGAQGVARCGRKAVAHGQAQQCFRSLHHSRVRRNAQGAWECECESERAHHVAEHRHAELGLAQPRPGFCQRRLRAQKRLCCSWRQLRLRLMRRSGRLDLFGARNRKRHVVAERHEVRRAQVQHDGVHAAVAGGCAHCRLELLNVCQVCCVRTARRDCFCVPPELHRHDSRF
mmetsp:Transcript_13286/g.55701  ORF Transcript_13286/g.55701 Transcript_13286/m.55701 type:complete len:205 (+) Transcript_13286:1609-2223(+)